MTTVKRGSLLEAIDATQTEPTSTASVYLDGAAWARGTYLKEEIRKSRQTDTGLTSTAPAFQAELDQVQAQIQASELKFTFRQLPKTEYSDLVDAHPSKDPGLAWDDKTFPPALVAAACIEVSGVYEAGGVSLEEVAGLWERLGNAQTDELFRAAFTLQLETPKPFTFAATAPITGSGLNSTSVTGSGESLTRGS